MKNFRLHKCERVRLYYSIVVLSAKRDEVKRELRKQGRSAVVVGDPAVNDGE